MSRLLEPCHGGSPRLILAAPSSGSGKTTLAIGIVSALRARGLRVAAAKSGPDFIDAAHLSRASGAPARNLDAWLAPPAVVARSFARAAHGNDVTIVEGAMGLFDGRHGSGDGSTAHLARILDAPVVLVLDCAKASSTIGAIAYGLARFDPRVSVVGAILNRVAGDKHAATVTDACRSAGVPVLGVVRRDERLALASRHLGLVAPRGQAWLDVRDAATDAATRHLDLDALLAIAKGAPPLAPALTQAPRPTAGGAVRVAIARDEAFWFYDEASLDALRDAGARGSSRTRRCATRFPMRTRRTSAAGIRSRTPPSCRPTPRRAMPSAARSRRECRRTPSAGVSCIWESALRPRMPASR